MKEIAKNSQEVIRFQLTEFKGKPYADIRVYYLDDKDDVYKPCKKGVCIGLDLWPAFVEGIEALGQEIQERGLLEGPEEDEQ